MTGFMPVARLNIASNLFASARFLSSCTALIKAAGLAAFFLVFSSAMG